MKHLAEACQRERPLPQRERGWARPKAAAEVVDDVVAEACACAVEYLGEYAWRQTRKNVEMERD